MEAIDEIPHHRLDLGPNFPLNGRADEHLANHAWLAAQIARDTRPAVIHASSGYRGYDHALVGMALRSHIRRPLVYEVRSFFESSWSQDERWNHDGELVRPAIRDRGPRHAGGGPRGDDRGDHARGHRRPRRPAGSGDGDPERRRRAAFSPPEPDPFLRDRYGLGDAFTFGYVTNLDHRRENQELLVEATAEPSEGAAAGSGSSSSATATAGPRRRRSPATRGVDGRRRVHGPRPHDAGRRALRRSDAFVVPRRDECASRHVTPLKPYEAHGHGTAARRRRPARAARDHRAAIAA